MGRIEGPNRKAPVHMPVVNTGDQAVIIFVTVCAARRRPILSHPDVHRVLVDAWHEADTWSGGRYVIMPDHIHLFCAPSAHTVPELKRWVQYWKTLASKNWPRPAEQPVWQKSFWDAQLRRESSYASKWEYVRYNPIRAGLCELPEDWPHQGTMTILPWHE